jgi:murein DD-endopeptidase MepM/ murein hydrolase activator NlpD
MEKKKYRISPRIILGVVAFALLGISALYFLINTSKTATHQRPTQDVLDEAELALPEPFFRMGFDTLEYRFVESILEQGQTLGSILLKNGFTHQDVYQVVQASEGIFDPRHVRPGEVYHTLFHRNDTSEKPHFMLYEKSPLVYYKFDFQDSVKVSRIEKETTMRIDTAVAIVESSLYEALQKQGVPVQVIMSMADLYGWSIDFFRIQKGDWIKLLYEVKLVDDSIPVSYGRIPAAQFFHGGKNWNAFWFISEDGEYSGYFDEKGDAMRKAFLKAPLDFFRISSRYNPKRFHPVLKKMKPHLGTDYAAPTGTPIRTTADGVIEKMGYTSGNGNYVKVRHNSVYSTQYLHMSRFAAGMKQGRAVQQGEVIGYVGSTGLATGPHVCYRFWKNGVQVDPLREELPTAEPIDEKYKENFQKKIDVLLRVLDELSLPEII